MNTRTLVKQLAALPDGPVTVSGWVETVRDQKKVQFIILRDESGAVQLVNPATRELDPEGVSVGAAEALALTESISALTHGTFISVTGDLKHDERVKLGGLEVKIGSLDVVSEALETPIAADSSLDKKSTATAGVPNLFGLETKLPGAINPANLATLGTNVLISRAFGDSGSAA